MTTVTLEQATATATDALETVGYPIYLMPRWWVAWQPSDTDRLQVAVPKVTFEMPVETWVPGDRIDQPAAGSGRSDSGNSYLGLLYALYIVPPIVFVLITLCCIRCCYVARRKRRHKEGFVGKPRIEFAEQSVPGEIELGDVQGGVRAKVKNFRNYKDREVTMTTG